MEGLKIRITLTGIVAFACRIALVPVLKKTQRVAVPAGDIQVLGEIEDEHDVEEGTFWIEEEPGVYLVHRI